MSPSVEADQIKLSVEADQKRLGGRPMKTGDGMPAVLDELRRDHGSMASVLDVLERQLSIFAGAGHPDYALMQAAADYFHDFCDRCHHPKEDLVFARMVQRDPGAVRAVGDLDAAHAKLADSLHDFAIALKMVVADEEVPRDAFVRWTEEFIALQRRHMAQEEANFFPAAARALTPEDWQEIDTTLTLTDPLIGPLSARFDGLRREIVKWEKA